MTAVLQHLQDDLQKSAAQQCSHVAGGVPVVYRQAARDHEAFGRANGKIHTITLVDRSSQPNFVLDMHFHREFQRDAPRAKAQAAQVSRAPRTLMLRDVCPTADRALQRLRGCKLGALQQYFVVHR